MPIGNPGAPKSRRNNRHTTQTIIAIPDEVITATDAQADRRMKAQHNAFVAALLKAHEDRETRISQSPGTQRPRPICNERIDVLQSSARF